MLSPTRAGAALSLVAAALLFAGCASTPGAQTPTSSPAPSVGGSDDMEGALLDDGRMFAVVTWGSSTCVPQIEDVSADGQTVSVTLVDSQAEDGTGQACTADLAPRASVGALPAGVDPTSEIALQVTYGDVTDGVELSGDASFTGIPASSTEYQPSAGWYDDGALVLLTWGSSGCPPVVESLEGAKASGTVTFTTEEDQVCTMDMAPRATLLTFDGEVQGQGFMLTLVGGGLDGTVTVRGD